MTRPNIMKKYPLPVVKFRPVIIKKLIIGKKYFENYSKLCNLDWS